MNQDNWLSKVPFFRIIIPFVLGIIFQIKFGINAETFFNINLIIFIFLVIFIIKKNFSQSYSLRWISGIFLCVFLFLSGSYLTYQKQVKLPNFNFSEEQTISAYIVENPVEKDKSIKATIELIAYKDSTNWENIKGKTIIYFEKDSLAKSLKFGDEIIFNITLNEIKNSGNPYEFDYQAYLRNNEILTQAYIPSDKWQKLTETQHKFIFYYANRIRNYLLGIYKKYNFEEKEFAILSALTLGYKAELDSETKAIYSSTGAMHILAVSGLHVGVIYMILNYLFKPFNKYRRKKYFKIFFITINLWIFALISGCSPSVIRASLMFTLVLFSELLEREKNIYNVIGTSMFIMLIYNPYVITEVGFQLSYLAVISIIFFQPRIYRFFYVKNKFLDKIWALVSVSIAAQLGTLPISLFYFHQFPVYFLLTNIIAVPTATIILYSSILLLSFSFIDKVAGIIAFLLNWILKFLNFSIEGIENLPFSSIKHIFINFPQTIILYLLIISITVFLIKENKKFLFLSSICVLMFFGFNAYRKIQTATQKSLVVYNVNNSCAVNFINGKNNLLICDTNVINNDKTFSFIFYNNWLNRNIRDFELFEVEKFQENLYFDFPNEFQSSKNEFINFFGKKILLMREKTLAENISENTIDLDYIILSNNIYVKIEDVLQNFNTEKIIFDSSNKPWRIESWKEQCIENNIDYFSVPDSGAFVLNL